MKNNFLTLLLLAFTLISAQAKIVYVNGAYTGVSTGASWDAPFKTLEAAIDAAASGDEIWIAKGEYIKDNTNSSPNHTLTKSLSFYGGFLSGQMSKDDRDITLNRTVIKSGSVLFLIESSQLQLKWDGLFLTSSNPIINSHVQNGKNVGNAYLFNHVEMYDCSGPAFSMSDSLYKIDFVDSKIYNTSYGIQTGVRGEINLERSDFFGLTGGNVVRAHAGTNLNVKDCKIYDCVKASAPMFYGEFDVTGFYNLQVNSVLNNNIFQFQANQTSLINSKFTNIQTSGRDAFGVTANKGVYSKVVVNNCKFENIKNNYNLLDFGVDEVIISEDSIIDCETTGDLIPLNYEVVKNVTISKCQFLKNNVGTGGGSLIHVGNVLKKSNFNIKTCEFRQNTVNNGSLFYANSCNDVYFDDVIIEDNVAKGYTQGLGYFGSINNLKLNKINAKNNILENAFTQKIFEVNNVRDFTLSNSNFYNSKTESLSNGFFLELEIANSSGKIESCQFTRNLPKDIHLYQAIRSNSGVFLEINNSLFEGYNNSAIIESNNYSGELSFITGCTFKNNSSLYNGGALSLANPIIRKSVFINNKSDSRGGAISSGYLDVDQCYFEGNQSKDVGGAISISGVVGFNGGGIFKMGIIKNTIFYNNYSNDKGGAVEGSCLINNCTLDGNHANDDSKGDQILYVSNYIKNINISNSIIWNNKVSLNYDSKLSNLSITNSLIQGGFPGEGNLDLNPEFVDPANGDFRLSCNSPAINAGNNSNVTSTLDLDGKPRIYAGAVDMGAYESAINPATSSALPKVAFTPSLVQVCRTESIVFANQTTNSQYYTYRWNFGDGTAISEELSPIHAFTKPGNYNVKLIAYNACGGKDSLSKTIQVKTSQLPAINYATSVCPNAVTDFSTNAVCGKFTWTVTGGVIQAGQGTAKITVKWGSGNTGNGNVALVVQSCSSDFCELPVSVSIPIVPVATKIIGNNLVCKEANEKYTTNLTDPAPGTLYNWRVKNGKISGSASGYQQYNVLITWDNTEAEGKVYLETYNELLKCGGTDSFSVQIAPKLKVSGNILACQNSKETYQETNAKPVTWSATGTGNTVTTAGVVSWSTGGTYNVIATKVNKLDYCTTKDTLQVVVVNKPILSAIVGEFDVDTNQTYTYTVTSDVPNTQFNWAVTGAKLYEGQNTAILKVIWGKAAPYKLDVTGTINSSCISALVSKNLTQAFMYAISGNDQNCIGTSASYTVTKDPVNTISYKWYLNGVLQAGTTFSNTIVFSKPGANELKVEATRLGKVSVVTKTIQVLAEPASLTVQGETLIAPTGDYTTKYIVTNPNNISYSYTNVGAKTITKVGDELTATWSGDGPFSLTLIGQTAGKTCTDNPVVVNVERAAALPTTLKIVTGTECLNQTVTYLFEIDKTTKDLQWTLSGGGVITKQSDNQVTVDWNNVAGTYNLVANYTRFGTQSNTFPISLGALPSVAINDALICGTTAVSLTTTPSNFSTYTWTSETSSITAMSSTASCSVSKSDIYYVEVSNTKGCKARTKREIQQLPIPQANIITPSSLNYCQINEKETIQLTTTQGDNYSYTWYKNGIALSGQATNTLSAFDLDKNTIQTVSYTVKAAIKSCEASSTITFNVYSSGSTFCTSNGGGGGGGNPCLDPVVSFDLNGYQPATVTNTTTTISTLPWEWNFGNSEFSTLKDPTNKIAFTGIGFRTITLRRGCATASSQLEIPAEANFELESKACSGNQMIFKSYSVNTPSTPIESWEWDFGDNIKSTGTGSKVSDGIHTYAMKGSYVVSLTVKAKDSKGVLRTSTSSKTIEVKEGPKANFTFTTPSCSDNLISFTNTSQFSTASATFDWTFGEAKTATTMDAAVRYTDYASNPKTPKLRVTDAFGCFSEKSVSFTVNVPVEKSAITVSGEKVLCNGKTVTLISPTSTGGSYSWKKDGQTLTTPTTASFVVNQPGKYAVVYKANATCSVTTDEVEISNFAIATSVTGKSSVCEGENILLMVPNIGSDYSISWRKGTTPLTTLGSELFVSQPKTTDAGKYIATVIEISTGCKIDLPEYNVTISPNPSQPTASVSNTKVCYNGSLTLNDYSTATGISRAWLKNKSPLVGVNKAEETLSNITDVGSFTVSLEHINTVSGCKSVSEPVQITVTPSFTVLLSGDVDQCEGTYSFISAGLTSTDYTFNWYKKKGNVLLANKLNKLEFQAVSLADTGTYYVIATTSGNNGSLSGCSATSAPITVKTKKSPIKPIITGETEFCTGSQVVLSTNVTQNFSWNTKETSPSITVIKSGTYTVTNREPATGCTLSASKTVVQNSLPDFGFIPTGVYERCGNEMISLKGTSQFPTFQWYKDGVKYGKENEELIPYESGKYSLSATTSASCSGNSDTIRINALLCGCYVLNTLDSGYGSLRQAIECANTKKGKDGIAFQLTGTGPFTIKPKTALPLVTEAIVIDGFSQSGDGKYDVILDGSSFTTSAFVFDYGVDGSIVKGLQFKGYTNAITLKSGIDNTLIKENKFLNITGSAIHFNTLTSTNTIFKNEFSGTGVGVLAEGTSTANTIEGNTFATLSTGIQLQVASNKNTIKTNSFTGVGNGVRLDASAENTVTDNEFISSTKQAILVQNKSASNTFSLNKIGISKAGVSGSIKNNAIEMVDSRNNTIFKNTIVNADSSAIKAVNSPKTWVNENTIGTATLTNKKYGVWSNDTISVFKNTITNQTAYGIYTLKNAFILENTLVNNKLGGVQVVSGIKNKISKNIITTTDKVGAVKAITLQQGANYMKLQPKYEGVKLDGENYLITISSLVGDSVQLFGSNGFKENANQYLASEKVNTNGKITFSVPKDVFRDFVATAIDTDGNTSELSIPIHIRDIAPDGVCPVVNTLDAGDGSLRQAITDVNAGFCDKIHFAISGVGPYIIEPQTELPTIAASSWVLIDGSTQLKSGKGSGKQEIWLNKNRNTFVYSGLKGEKFTLKELNLHGFSEGLSMVEDFVVDKCILDSCYAAIGLSDEDTSGSKIEVINSTFSNCNSSITESALTKATLGLRYLVFRKNRIYNRITNYYSGITPRYGFAKIIVDSCVFAMDEQNKVFPIGYYPLQMWDVDSIEILNSQFLSSDLASVSHKNFKYSIISNNKFGLSSDYKQVGTLEREAIILENGIASNVKISGNEIANTKLSGIFLNNVSNGTKTSEIVKNYIGKDKKGNTYTIGANGISLEGGKFKGKINENVISHVTNSGISIGYNGNDSIYSISNNVIHDAKENGIKADYGSWIGGIDNNKIDSVGFGSSSQNHGITINNFKKVESVSSNSISYANGNAINLIPRGNLHISVVKNNKLYNNINYALNIGNSSIVFIDSLIFNEVFNNLGGFQFEGGQVTNLSKNTLSNNKGTAIFCRNCTIDNLNSNYVYSNKGNGVSFAYNAKLKRGEGNYFGIDYKGNISLNADENIQFSNLTLTQSILAHNYFYSKDSASVKMDRDWHKTFSQNVFYNFGTGKSIELKNSGNNNKAIPQILKSRYANPDSLVITGKSAINDTVEVFLNNGRPQNAIVYLGKSKSDSKGEWKIVIVGEKQFKSDTAIYLVATATDVLGNTSEFTSPFIVAKKNINSTCLVTNLKNDGGGSLREAIYCANNSVYNGDVAIKFAIDTNVALELPISTTLPILERLNYKVILDGKNLLDNKIVTLIPSGVSKGLWGSNFEINNFLVNNFDTGIVVLNSGYIYKTIFNNNKIGVSVSGTKSKIWNNAFSNQVSNNVLIKSGKENSVLYNKFTGDEANTAKAITLLNGSNNSQKAPSNIFVNGKTVSGQGIVGDTIHIYSSVKQLGQALSYVIKVNVDASNKWIVTIPDNLLKPNENTYFVATATDSKGNTSELSIPFRVGDFPIVCPVKNTLNTGVGSLRAAIDCVNEAGLTGSPAKVEFRLPTTAENKIVVLSSGFKITNSLGVLIDAQNVPVKLESSNITYAFTWDVNNVTVKNLKFEKFQSGVVFKGDNNYIDNNTFTSVDKAITVNGGSSSSILNNTIDGGTIGVFVNQAKATVSYNKIGTTTPVKGTAILLKKATNSTVERNQIPAVLAASNHPIYAKYNAKGIVVDSSEYVNLNYNILKASSDTTSSILINKTYGSTLFANETEGGKVGIELIRADFTKAESNKTNLVKVAGILAKYSPAVILSKNTASDLPSTAKPIELNYNSTKSSNQDKQIPEFKFATYKNGELILRGRSLDGDAVEVFYTDKQGVDLDKYVATVSTDEFNEFEYSFSVAPDKINDYDFRATATINTFYAPAGQYTSEASKPYNPNLKLCNVTNNLDDTLAGSLRYNITLANREECNLMLFRLPVSQLVISPKTDLPEIMASNLTIDATSQPGYASQALVELYNEDFKNILNVNSNGGVYIHGLKFNKSETPLVITKVQYFENTLSEYLNFTSSAIDFKSTAHKQIRIDNNQFVSAHTKSALEITSPNVLIKDNIIDAGNEHAIVVRDKKALILGNKIKYSALVSPVTSAILIGNQDSVILTRNVISNYLKGILAEKSSNLRIAENNINIYDRKRDTLRSAYFMTRAIEMNNVAKSEAVFNIIQDADTAIYVVNSPGIFVATNTLDSSKVAGVYVENCPKAVISSNIVSSTPIGLYIDSSFKTTISFNTLFNHYRTGILLTPTSDSTLLFNNVVGSNDILGSTFSRGSGITLLSNYNTIGGVENDTIRNYILNNLKGGVVVDGSMGNRITHNSIYFNDSVITRPVYFAIEHLNEGNKEKSRPDSLKFKTLVKNKTFEISGIAQAFDTIHLYLSEGYYQNARYFAAKAIADASGKWKATIDTSTFIPKLALYQTISLVATATDKDANTSKLSEILYVGTCYINVLDDNADNDYPYPNSFRQAVKCANSQDEEASILFGIQEGSEKRIYTVREMIPLENKYGVTFNGKNLARHTENITVTNGNYDTTLASSVFWKITDKVGASQFKNLKMTFYDTAIVFAAPHRIEVDSFSFESIANNAILLVDTVEQYNFKHLNFTKSLSATAFSNNEKVQDLSVTNSIFEFQKNAILISNTENVRLDSNKFSFGTVYVKVKNTDTLSVVGNEFNLDNNDEALRLDEINNGSVSKNKFQKEDKDQTTVVINQAHKLTISNNVFEAEYFKTVFDIQQSDSLYIEKNKADKIATFFQLKNDTACSFIANEATGVAESFFDLQQSERMLMSQNIVSKMDLSSAKETKLYKAAKNQVSNKNKETPIIDRYTTKYPKGKCDQVESRLGLYLTVSNTSPKDVIEVFFSDSLTVSTKKYLVSGKADSVGTWEILIPREFYIRKPNEWYNFVVTATDTVGNTSELSNAFRFKNVSNDIVVRKIIDDTVSTETLRDAVNRVNCSDLYSNVRFEIAELTPHQIVLKDTLPQVYCYLGCNFNALTQKSYADTNKITADPTIILQDNSVLKRPYFIVNKASDSTRFEHFTFKDVAKGVKLKNGSGNLLKNLTFNSTLKGDTAIYLDTTSSNKLIGNKIFNYNVAVDFNQSTNNLMDRDTISNVKIAASLHDGSSNNKITKCIVQFDSLGVKVKGIKEFNYITKNVFGDPNYKKELNGPSIAFVNSDNQIATDNTMFFANANGENIPAFIYGKNVNKTSIVRNKIRGFIEESGDAVYSDFRGVWLTTGKDTVNYNNTVSTNEIYALSQTAVVVENASGGSVSGNYVGIDSAGYTIQGLKNYSKVPGIKSNAMLFVNSEYMSVANNEIVNFTGYGVELRSSDFITVEKNKILSLNSIAKGIQHNEENEFLSNNKLEKPVIDFSDILSIDKILLSGTGKPSTQIYLYQAFEENIQSSRYITQIEVGADGKWKIELPSENFGFSVANKYVAQTLYENRTSEYSDRFVVVGLLCKLKDKGVKLMDPLYKPCPKSQFTVDAGLEGLHYEWTSTMFDTITTREAKIDTNANVHFKIWDDFNCIIEEDFEVKYKDKAVEPNFIISSSIYVGDTIVLVDISIPKPTTYEWSSSDKITVIPPKDGKTVLGPDGKQYAEGQTLQFIVPDTGTYKVKQTSLREDCFVSLEKTFIATYKDPTVENPYELVAEIQQLYVYPSPSVGQDQNAFIKVSTLDPMKIEVYSSMGGLVYTDIVAGKKQYVLPLKNASLEDGIYIIKLNSPSGVVTYKFQK